MRYLLKQKLFSWGDDYLIQDDTGRDVFLVDGAAFGFGKQLSFQDLSGLELVRIKQKLLSFGHRFEILKGGEVCAVVKKEMFTLLKCRFSVDVPGPEDLEAEGDFLEHDYRFVRAGEVVATVSKKWFSWADTYGVEIAEGEDDALILACTVVIDMACHDGKE